MKIVTLLWCPVCKRMTAHEIQPSQFIRCVTCLNRVPEPPVIPINPLIDLVEGLLGRRPK